MFLEILPNFSLVLFDYVLQLKHLDLSENIIYGEGATHLASCVANIDELVLEYCYIDAKGARDLAEAIKKRAGKVSKRRFQFCI